MTQSVDLAAVYAHCRPNNNALIDFVRVLSPVPTNVAGNKK